jgi:hypothetical protein
VSVQLPSGEVAKIGFVGAMNPEEVDLMKMFVDGCMEQAKDSYGKPFSERTDLEFPNPDQDVGTFEVASKDDCQCTNCIARREIMAEIMAEKKDQI